MEQISLIEKYCKIIYDKSSNPEDIKNSDEQLTKFIKFENFEILKLILYQSTYSQAKFYASNSMTTIITQNYLSVSLNDKIEIYDNILIYMDSNNEQLFMENKFLLNSLITLLCRIVRISWLQSPKFKSIIYDVLNNIKEENTFTMIIPFLIYTELIYQFQIADLPPKNKIYRFISDFKEFALLHIYENASGFLINIFKQSIKFENLEHYLYFIKELSKCLNACMEYEEDLNIKDENYKRFEIKPIYVPNNKKRSKDKSLDLDLLINLCKSLFDTHSVLVKMIKENNLNSIETTDYCLTLLQKFSSVKLVYLGDSKMQFLNCLQDGIISLIKLKNGLDNHRNLEEFCKLIFLLKKNFNVIELLNNTAFIESVYRFLLDCLDYYPNSGAGLVYLIRFFGYFSAVCASSPIPNKDEVKTILYRILVETMKKVLSHVETIDDIDEINENRSLLIDLVDAIAVISRAIFINANLLFIEFYDNILQSSNMSIIHPMWFIKLSFIIYFSTSVISFNQKVLLEKDFVNKVMDDEENIHLGIKIQESESFSLNYSEESQVVSQILLRIFKVIDLYFAMLQQNNSINSQVQLIFQQSLFYFLKNFSKLFLSKKLSCKYENIFPIICEVLKLEDDSMILRFIISILMELCKYSINLTDKNSNYVVLQNVVKIFQLIIENVYVTIDVEGVKTMRVGKLNLPSSFLTSFNDLNKIVVEFDPLKLGKYRKIFYKSLCKILLLKESSITNEDFNSLLEYYTINILNSKDKIPETVYVLLGYIKDLNGICCSITRKTDYNNFINKIFSSLVILKEFYKYNCHFVEVNLAMLKLIEEITDNHLDRIHFLTSNSASLPVKMLNLVHEVMGIYQNSVSIDVKDDYLKHIKPSIILLKIFKNFFIGRFLHFGSYIQNEHNLKQVETMFINICDLIISIKFENFLGHISKTNIAYYLIKVIFYEYVGYLNIEEKFTKYFDFIVKLINEGLESLDNVVLITTHQIIFEWGKMFIDKNIDIKRKNFVIWLFSTYEETFQNFLNKLLKSIINGEITSLQEISNSLFVLCEIYPTYYMNLTNSLIFSVGDLHQNKLKILFEGLFKDVKNSLDYRNLGNFGKNLKEFSNEIQGLL